MSTNAIPVDLEPTTPAVPPAAEVMKPFSRTCSPFSTITEASLVLKDEHFGLVPVVDAGKPVGVVYEQDLALRSGIEPDLDRQPVSSIMRDSFLTVTGDTPVDQALQQMKEAGEVISLVVDANGLLLGCLGPAELAA